MGSKNYELAFASGYLTAINDLSWTCDDCDNTYGPDIDNCPNVRLHDAIQMQKSAIHAET